MLSEIEMDKKYQIRICKNTSCKRKLYVSKKEGKSHRLPTGVRPKSAFTCSMTCSKESFRNKKLDPKERASRLKYNREYRKRPEVIEMYKGYRKKSREKKKLKEEKK